ncbi:hypothetical protein EU537_07545 [Candidatus Thorarchaeota archaeon]|nr:MAG: hypothetical protein EU537_07545 [Candidatus Thorarchaeota archaeon]
MFKTIIVYESVYGNTKHIAEEIGKGVDTPGNIQVEVVKPSEIHTDQLLDYDAILLGCPNHNQKPANNLVKFIERASIVHPECKIGAAFDTYTGGNKGVALNKLEKIIKDKLPGIEFVMSGLSCKVEGRKGPLAEGEKEQAFEFGVRFAKKLQEDLEAS